MAFGRLPTMSGEFRVAKDPDLRFQENGDPICTIWCVTNSQRKDEQTNKWVDDKTLWLKVVLWKNDGAENAANSIQKSDIVSVVCEPFLNEFVKDGQKKTFLETNRVISFGASIRFRSMPHGQQRQQAQQPPQGQSQPEHASWGNGPADEKDPPF